MSYSRVPKPTRHTEDGLLFPVEIETVSPQTVTDALTVGLSGNRVRIDARTIDPLTRVLSACFVEMAAKDGRHFLGLLTKVVEAAEAAGG